MRENIMYNELTQQDIAIMEQELQEKRLVELPAAIEEVKRTRAFGDLSENYEYKAAKQVQNAEVADKVYEQMEPNRLYTVSEMIKVLPIFAEMSECSASYANAIVKKLKDAGRVTRSVDKGRAYFCKVVD
jgi:hypothetical protein